MKTDTDHRPIRDLVFHPGENGFVFYDDRGPLSGRIGETARTWAFSTIDEAAAWLHGQFCLHEEEGKRRPDDQNEPDVPHPFADHVRRTIQHAPGEGSVDQLMLSRLLILEPDEKVTLYVGDVRHALHAAAAGLSSSPERSDK